MLRNQFTQLPKANPAMSLPMLPPWSIQKLLTRIKPRWQRKTLIPHGQHGAGISFRYGVKGDIIGIRRHGILFLDDVRTFELEEDIVGTAWAGGFFGFVIIGLLDGWAGRSGTLLGRSYYFDCHLVIVEKYEKKIF